jgi:hypothetical protein
MSFALILATLFTAKAPVTAPLQTSGSWETRTVGTGGETFVSTDGKGTVYISSHIPSQILTSRDSGASFGAPVSFPDSLGDVTHLALPDGRVIVTYLDRKLNGLIAQSSKDYGKTFTKGNAPFNRPLDREWLAYDAKRKQTALIYSDGYIGGPKSKGVFVAVSPDDGITWKETARVDNETAGSYAIDPHIVSLSDGTLVGFWNTSVDYDKVNSFRTARSLDGGKTFTGHQTLQVIDPASGDTQERWMLGGLASFGKSEVSAFFVRYESMALESGPLNTMRVCVRTSKDGGKTFGPARNVTRPDELTSSAASFLGGRLDATEPFRQVMAWGAYDPTGTLHLIWFDNRYGQSRVGEKSLSRWQLRYAALRPGQKDAVSEPVGKPFAAARPALDFICCAADRNFVYVTWTENQNSASGYDFSGTFMFARKKLAK